MSRIDAKLAWALAWSAALHVVLLNYLDLGRFGDELAVASHPLQVTLAPARPSFAPAQEVMTPVAKAEPATHYPLATVPDVAHGGMQQAPIPIPMPDDRYLLSSEVDVRAQPVHIAALVYPEIAHTRRIAGKVQLKVFISETGKIDSVDVIQADPPGIFEEAALKALLATEFTPAQKDGHNVKSQKLLELAFDPYENINLP